jgi:hypothetical protein
MRPSIARQIFRHHRRSVRGVGQSVSALSSAPGCSNWVTVSPSDPMWPVLLPLIQQAGFGTTQPAPVTNGDYHFTFSVNATNIPGQSVFSGMVSPGLPAGTFFCKVNTVNSITDLSDLKVEACLTPGASAAVAGGGTIASSSTLPYILAGIVGVAIVGGVIYYATE